MPDPIVRLELIAYPYELKATDLLIDDDRREVSRVDPTADELGIVVTFADGSSTEHPRLEIVTIARDRQLMPGFENVDPPEPSA